MFLGAVVDAGVPARELEEAVSALGVGARLEISRVMRSGISATKVDVWVDGEKDLPRGECWDRREQEHADGHSHRQHEHTHHDQHEHVNAGDLHSLPGQSSRAGVPAAHDLEHETERASRPLPHEHGHSHQHSHGRRLTEIREIISAAAISERAKKTAIAIFEALGAAEAKIHDTSIEGVHFHEVGAVDALVDIVCAAVGAEAL